MWCPKCQADVAAEVGADNRRIRCATCGSEIDALRTLRTAEKTREARELLQRWSSGRPLDVSAAPTEPPEISPATNIEPPRREPAPAAAAPSSSKSAMRFDQPHPAAPAEPHEPSAAVTASAPTRPTVAVVAVEPVPVHRPHAAHAAIPAPHGVDVQSAIISNEPRPTNWLAACGQLLAYAGVLGLTVGTTLVLWGYFGGPEQQGYAPTGWLVATAGQMLLFLGVVTLVSGGMEQTTDEVRRQIDTLGDRLGRIEQILRQPPPREAVRPAERGRQTVPAPERAEQKAAA